MHLLLLLIATTLQSSTVYTKTITSTITKDSYTYRVTLPPNFDKNKTYDLVLYLGDQLNSGKEMRNALPKIFNDKSLSEVIAVGIRHQGNYKTKRRRDFIPAHLLNSKTGKYYSDNKDYGQAALFHSFLKKELLPIINSKYKLNKKTIVGHSFGGLFAIYAMFQPNQLFDNYVAISPSLWVNYQNIFKFEEQYHQQSKSLKGRLFLCCGNLEVLNLIWHNVDLLEYRLKERKYKELVFKKVIFQGYAHVGTAKPGISKGLKYVLKQ